MLRSTTRPTSLLAAASVAAAIVLSAVPVDATYVNRVGSDTVEYRTASCDPAIGALLGSTPDLGGGSEHPIGGATASSACEAAAGKRMVLAVAALLVAALIGRVRSRGDVETRPAQPR